ncbi:MAG: bifunctional nuclease family protein [Acidobacteria bacterium]|nr:bifunctional nuclease family protein [Acidobacteriota bacterium]
MSENGPIPMEVLGVRVELPSNQPIVLLREQDGERHLPIWIGGAEATAIATALEGVTPPRPLTHDLMRAVLDAVGASATRVVITEMRDSVFYADLALDISGREVHVSSRPSDAIALAVRTGTPVYALESVLEDAGVVFEEEGGEDEEEVARFREFLEEVTIEDFLGDDSAE